MFKSKIQNTLEYPFVLRFGFLILNLFGVSDLGFRFLPSAKAEGVV
jgi:hypothetical protein